MSSLPPGEIMVSFYLSVISCKDLQGPRINTSRLLQGMFRGKISPALGGERHVARVPVEHSCELAINISRR